MTTCTFVVSFNCFVQTKDVSAAEFVTEVSKATEKGCFCEAFILAFSARSVPGPSWFWFLIFWSKVRDTCGHWSVHISGWSYSSKWTVKNMKCGQVSSGISKVRLCHWWHWTACGCALHLFWNWMDHPFLWMPGTSRLCTFEFSEGLLINISEASTINARGSQFKNCKAWRTSFNYNWVATRLTREWQNTNRWSCIPGTKWAWRFR